MIAVAAVAAHLFGLRLSQVTRRGKHRGGGGCGGGDDDDDDDDGGGGLHHHRQQKKYRYHALPER